MKIFVFKAILKERGITDKMTAGLLGVSVATFRRRLKDGSFRAREIALLSRALGLSDLEVCDIFFGKEVAQRKQ